MTLDISIYKFQSLFQNICMIFLEYNTNYIQTFLSFSFIFIFIFISFNLHMLEIWIKSCLM